MTFANPGNITGYFEILQYANTVTGGWFGNIIVIMLFFITFISLKTYPTNRAFAVASFVSAVVAILFIPIGIVSDFVVFLAILSTGISIVALLVEEN